MTEENEKKNRRIALFTTIGVNGILLVLLLFVIAWKAPDPPLPEYGIELNFGMDSQGSGDIQPEVPVGDESTENEQQESTPEEIVPEESVPETSSEQTAPTETAVEEVSNKQDSPIVVKEKKEEKKKEEKTIEEKIEKKDEVKKEESKQAEKKSDTRLEYNKSKTNTESTTGKEGAAGSQGDDANKAGDKGSPQGKVDAESLYGKAGGGSGGAGLDLAGWDWDEIPRPNVTDNQTGRVVFEIQVDEQGELVGIKTIERSVSDDAYIACRKAVDKLTFSKKPGAVVPSISKGKITFIIRAK